MMNKLNSTGKKNISGKFKKWINQAAFNKTKTDEKQIIN